MPAEKLFDFTNFEANLMRTYDGNGALIMDYMIDGVSALQNDFAVRLVRDKLPLLSIKFKDAFKKASDSFEGRKAVEVRSRFAEFDEGDIDLEFTYSDIREAWRTYLGWLKEPGRSLADVRDNPFELFFVRGIINAHFAFVREKTAWGGISNATAIGAENITDGLLKKLTAGRASGGDILASHVYSADVFNDSTAYEEVNGVAQLVADVKPVLLRFPLNCYLSQQTYDKYRRNRRTLFPNHVSPSEKPTTLDDYSNISLVVDPGLAGKDTVVITPKENLLFTGNESAGAYSLNVVKQIKSYQISIRVSMGFNYASPDLLFLNDAV